MERSLLEVEGYVRDFATDNPHVRLSLLRFSNVIGTDIVTPLTKALELPVVPKIAGLRPALPVRARDRRRRRRSCSCWLARCRACSTWPVTGRSRGARWPASPASARSPCRPTAPPSPSLPCAALGLVDLPPELLDLLRYGRGVDNRRLKDEGFRYRYTSAGAVQAFAQEMRLRNTVGRRERDYRYQEDVERWFRHSSAVIRNEGGP